MSDQESISSSDEEVLSTTWSVVGFLEDDEVRIAVVPSTWIEGDHCYWPPYRSDKVSQLIKKRTNRDQTWEKYPIKPFTNATFDDYALARNKAKKAEATSDLQSDAESVKRKSKPRKFDSSSENEDLVRLPVRLPKPPKKKSILDSLSVAKPNSVSFESLEATYYCEPTLDKTAFEKNKLEQTNCFTPTQRNTNVPGICQDKLSTDITLHKLYDAITEIKAQNHMLRGMLADLTQEVQKISNKKSVEDRESFFTAFKLNFPLKTENEMNEFENKLLDGESFNHVMLNTITQKMKEKDSLFKEMFKHVFYGGSYYDGLKVGKPEEFDLDLLLKLPPMINYQLKAASNLPGYVTLKILNKQPTLDSIDLKVKYKGFDKLINSNCYLDNRKVRAWIEGVVTQAMNDFGKHGQYVLQTTNGSFNVIMKKSGPAFTLKATGYANGRSIVLDIDLVPCILFQQVDWPKDVGYMANPVPSKTTFFIVPKPLKGMTNVDHYWRLSFQEQERVLIDGKGPLKPAIKLLKKMRDHLNHKALASYYIKTVALRLVAEKSPDFWQNPVSYVFMTLMKEYQRCLDNRSIVYFWNKNFNLIRGLNTAALSKISCDIKKAIDDIENHPNDPVIVGKYLVTAQELQRV